MKCPICSASYQIKGFYDRHIQDHRNQAARTLEHMFGGNIAISVDDGDIWITDRQTSRVTRLKIGRGPMGIRYEIERPMYEHAYKFTIFPTHGRQPIPDAKQGAFDDHVVHVCDYDLGDTAQEFKHQYATERFDVLVDKL